MVLIADKRPRLTARHFNDIQNAVRRIQTVQCSLSGSAINKGMRIYSEWGGTVATFYPNCCPDAVKYSSGAIGLTKITANQHYEQYDGDAFIDPLTEKYPLFTKGTCDGDAKDDSGLLIANQAGWANTGAETNFMGTDGNFTTCQFMAKPFIIDQLERLPDESVIVKATVEIQPTNLVKHQVIQTFRINDAGTGMIMVNYDVIDITENVPLSAMLLATDVNGVDYVISLCSNLVTANNDVMCELDITDLAQNYLSIIRNDNIGFKNFALTITPNSAIVTNVIYADRHVMLSVRDSSWHMDFIDFQNVENACDRYVYPTLDDRSFITYNGFAVGRVFLTFALPSLTGWKVPIGNLPGFEVTP